MGKEHRDGINLQSAWLKQANLREAILNGADFRGASLNIANFVNSSFGLADFWGAKFAEANFHYADFRWAKNLDKAIWPKDWKLVKKSDVSKFIAQIQQIIDRTWKLPNTYYCDDYIIALESIEFCVRDFLEKYPEWVKKEEDNGESITR
jgi:hypothetical protein